MSVNSLAIIIHCIILIHFIIKKYYNCKKDAIRNTLLYMNNYVHPGPKFQYKFTVMYDILYFYLFFCPRAGEFTMVDIFTSEQNGKQFYITSLSQVAFQSTLFIKFISYVVVRCNNIQTLLITFYQTKVYRFNIST